MKKVAGPLRLNLAQYRELQAFSQFGSDLDKATQDILRKGARIAEVLKQSPAQSKSMPVQVFLLHLATNSHFDNIEVYDVRPFCDDFSLYLEAIQTKLLEKIAKAEKIDEDLNKEMLEIFSSYYEQWKQEQLNATTF